MTTKSRQTNAQSEKGEMMRVGRGVENTRSGVSVGVVFNAEDRKSVCVFMSVWLEIISIVGGS